DKTANFLIRVVERRDKGSAGFGRPGTGLPQEFASLSAHRRARALEGPDTVEAGMLNAPGPVETQTNQVHAPVDALQVSFQKLFPDNFSGAIHFDNPAASTAGYGYQRVAGAEPGSLAGTRNPGLPSNLSRWLHLYHLIGVEPDHQEMVAGQGFDFNV